MESNFVDKKILTEFNYTRSNDSKISKSGYTNLIKNVLNKFSEIFKKESKNENFSTKYPSYFILKLLKKKDMNDLKNLLMNPDVLDYIIRTYSFKKEFVTDKEGNKWYLAITGYMHYDYILSVNSDKKNGMEKKLYESDNDNNDKNRERYEVVYRKIGLVLVKEDSIIEFYSIKDFKTKIFYMNYEYNTNGFLRQSYIKDFIIPEQQKFLRDYESNKELIYDPVKSKKKPKRTESKEKKKGSKKKEESKKKKGSKKSTLKQSSNETIPETILETIPDSIQPPTPNEPNKPNEQIQSSMMSNQTKKNQSNNQSNNNQSKKNQSNNQSNNNQSNNQSIK